MGVSYGTTYYTLGRGLRYFQVSFVPVSLSHNNLGRHRGGQCFSLLRTSFHPLTNRKHHCRLCGRIICSLPPKNPQRPATCSILFVVDSKTRRIEEVDEGVDYGVKKRRNPSIGKADEIDNDEKFLKGVRICRECRPILLCVFLYFAIVHADESLQARAIPTGEVACANFRKAA